jgi:hypothetical protein
VEAQEDCGGPNELVRRRKGSEPRREKIASKCNFNLRKQRFLSGLKYIHMTSQIPSKKIKINKYDIPNEKTKILVGIKIYT